MLIVQSKLVRWLFIVFTLKQLIWVAFIPPWQFPDEQAHFAQVQNFAERKSMQPFSGPNTSKEISESEKLLGTKRDGFGNNQFTYHPEYKLPLDHKTTNDIESAIQQIPPDYRYEYVMYEATVYPPLYYMLGTLPYFMVYKGDLLTRVFAVRLINLPIYLLLLYFVYKSGELLFENNRRLTFLLLILVGFHPMFSFVSAGTTSDNLYNLLTTIVVYLCLKLIKNGWSHTWLLESFIVAVLLWWTKPQAKLAYLIFGAAILFLFAKRKRSPKPLLFILALIVIVSLGLMVNNLLTGQQFLPEIPVWGIFANPQLSLASHLKWSLVHTYREVMPWYWGVFRWLSLTYPRAVHRSVNWLVVFALIGLFRYLFTRDKNRIVNLRFFWFLITANVLYFLGLFVFDYLFTRGHGFSFGIQGRYYFPLIMSQMTLIIIGFYSLFKNELLRRLLLLTVGLGMMIWHLYAQWFVSISYLTPQTLIEFFLQASQYKALWFKSPVLELFTGAYLLSLVVFTWYYIKVFTRYETRGI